MGIQKNGFTLLELLVTISLLGVLAALTMPALAKAKAAARRVQCINNQRQLDLAWMTYASDNDDFMVPNGVNSPPSAKLKMWVQGIFYFAESNTNAGYLLDPKYALFAPFFRSTKSYVCPSDKAQVQIEGKSYPKVRSYSLNAYAGWVGAWDERLSSGHRVFKKTSQLVAFQPSRMFTFGEVNPDSICWPYLGVTMQEESFFNFPASAHNQGGVLAFADGHVEHHKWRDSRTLRAFSTNYHRHQDASPKNTDLAWLRERATVPR